MLRLLLLTLSGGIALADAPEVAPVPKKAIDLTGYRTVAEALKADPKAFPTSGAKPQPLGHLGVAFREQEGRVEVDDVEANTAAEAAGLRTGDVVLAIDGASVASVSSARDSLRGRFAETVVTLQVQRDGQSLTIPVTLRPLSKPFASTDAPRAVLGIQVSRVATGGIEITSITKGQAAEAAKLEVGDIILKVNQTPVDSDATLREALSDKKPGDTVQLQVLRKKAEMEVTATLSAAETPSFGRGWDDRIPNAFRKPVYKLAVIGVEYPDTKHNEKITDKDWENQLFSRGSYTGKNATGSPVYGSVADYYHELSYGKLKLEGKFFGWVEVGKKKMDYNLGSSTSASDKSKFFNEMMDKFIAKHGKEALKGYDGIFVIFAGDRVQTSRGGLYWPHKANFTYDRQRYSYFIVPEMSNKRMTNISVICHEFGHMLGLPDLYARPEQPGSEGVGVWCAMSNQLPDGRPQHFSVWSKQYLGWVQPTLIDPRVRQKLILAPINDSPTECLKIPVRADGSEYFLLENRQKKGFDKELPAEGLLIWRVIPASRGVQQVYLEESHGITGPTGPRVFGGAVPFPSPANHAFTPFTTPSSKSQLGGGLDVSITNIQRLRDGRVIFHIGYEYQ